KLPDLNANAKTTAASTATRQLYAQNISFALKMGGCDEISVIYVQDNTMGVKQSGMASLKIWASAKSYLEDPVLFTSKALDILHFYFSYFYEYGSMVQPH
ncbi:hypothetical protein HK100_006376, partial [Physocladia obscura]